MKGNNEFDIHINNLTKLKSIEELSNELGRIRCNKNKTLDICEIERFENLKQKYIILQKKYADSFNVLKENIERNVCRREYAKGGEFLHRGFYSPSCLDLVVGVKRGRLLKKIPKDNKYTYEYLFDASNKLICVYKNEDFGGRQLKVVEYLIYNDESVLGLLFDSAELPTLHFVSECTFENGKLMKYESASCSTLPMKESYVEINIEVFDYSNNLIKGFDWYRYYSPILLLEHNRYNLMRDENGYYSTYTSENFSSNKNDPKTDKIPIVRNVLVKRK